ncbi:hypothetical protein GQ54DRAFT_33281 [Martensiomyces pterosporus]|nr:hypothetical protein GQ54DRAFT_33281 [Martensiomyces pterosporus]
MKVHVQPLRTQLQMAQERTDELLAEREELAAQVYTLRQEHSAALRRSNESAAAVEEARKAIERLEEDKAQARRELEEQRSFWTKRWSDRQEECKAGMLAEKDAQRAAERHAEDTAARLRAEQRADDLQMRYSAVQAEAELLRSQMHRMEEERVNEWEPMRVQWMNCEGALQELQETHQSTCEALAQAEAQLADLDKNTQLDDPIKLKSEKTSTSLLGELDLQRHQAVAQRQALVREHTALKRAYARALNSQSRMKQQVTRLTQLAATGANEARMKRLEAALGEAECQQQALLWASMEQRRSADADFASAEANAQMDGTALVTTLRTKLKQVTADREQAQRELRTAHLLRANEIQKTRDLERDAAEIESKLRRTVSELSSVKADYDALKRAVSSGRKQLKSPKASSKRQPFSATQASSPRDGAKSEQASSGQPPRKRTGPGVGEQGSVQKKSGPMSLAFVINDDQAPLSPSSPQDSHEEPPDAPPASAKRRKVPGTPSSRRGSNTPSKSRSSKQTSKRPSDSGKSHKSTRANAAASGPAAAAAAAESKVLSDMNDAADRGMKSWLGALGNVHATVSMAMGGKRPEPSTDARVAGASESSGSAANGAGAADTAFSTAQPLSKATKPSVDEIYISSRSSQKQIECNNQ